MQIKNFDHIRKYLPYRVKSFQGGTLTFRLKQWKELTSDREILATVSGMHTKITDNLPAVKLYQYPFSKKEQEFVAAEIKAKLVIVEKKHEPREFISAIFVGKKSDWGFRLILNLKRFNKFVEYKKFKMETISAILHLVRPGMCMAKLDIKDAYYSVPICEGHQSLLKFQYQTSLFKFTALPIDIQKKRRNLQNL